MPALPCSRSVPSRTSAENVPERVRLPRTPRFSSFRLTCLLLAASALVLAALIPPRLAAFEIADGQYFVFDIDNDADMREVGKRSGIKTFDDRPLSLGLQECRRWADQFNVRPYRAVVSGTIGENPGRVWICADPADSDLLSELYCKQMQMGYVKHERSVVTCRLPNRGGAHPAPAIALQSPQ